MFDNIDLGGVFIIIILALIVVGVMVAKRVISGQGFSFSMPTKQKKAEAADTVLSCSWYPDKVVVEAISKGKVCDAARWWDINGKKGVAQIIKGEGYEPLLLPDETSYPPSRLARMLGCIPLKKLKSLRFTWYENLAPFAPVIALVVVGFILLIVLD